MNRIRAVIAVSCFLHLQVGCDCFPISYAAAPSSSSAPKPKPKLSALSLFVPELDASIGNTKLLGAFPLMVDVETNSKKKKKRSGPAHGHGPPVDAVYELEAKIPVIGTQRFQLKIRTEGMAELVINGLLKLDDVIFYEVNRDGEFEFDLSEAAKKVLGKFRTKLVKVMYDSETDVPTVIVRPPLPTNIKLQLVRKDSPVLALA